VSPKFSLDPGHSYCSVHARMANSLQATCEVKWSVRAGGNNDNGTNDPGTRYLRRAALNSIGRRALAVPAVFSVSDALIAANAAPAEAEADVVEAITKLDDVVVPNDVGGKAWLWKKLQVCIPL
jgi:hypothetical protein